MQTGPLVGGRDTQSTAPYDHRKERLVSADADADADANLLFNSSTAAERGQERAKAARAEECRWMMCSFVRARSSDIPCIERRHPMYCAVGTTWGKGKQPARCLGLG